MRAGASTIQRLPVSKKNGEEEGDSLKHMFEELQRYEEIDAARTAEGLLSSIKVVFGGLVRMGRVCPELAIITRTLIEGTEKQRLSLALNMLRGNRSAMLRENNIIHLKGMTADRNAAADVLTYGDAIVESPLPLLWPSTAEARFANSVIMQAAAKQRRSAAEKQYGDCLKGSAIMPMYATHDIFKSPARFAMPADVARTVNAYTGVLEKGAGHPFSTGKDEGEVVLDPELAFAALINTIKALTAKYENDGQRIAGQATV